MKGVFATWETLSINLNCMWASSIDVMKTGSAISSSSCSPVLCYLRTQSALRVQQLDPRWRSGGKTLWAQQSLNSHCFDSLSPILSISFSCDQTLARAALNQDGLAWWLLFWLSSSLGQSSCMVQRRRGPWWSQNQLLLIWNTCFSLQWWGQYLCHGHYVFKKLKQNKWWSKIIIA